MSNDESIEKAADQLQDLSAAAQDASLSKQDQDKPAIPMLDDSTPDDEVRAFATHSRHVQNHLGGQLHGAFYGVVFLIHVSGPVSVHNPRAAGASDLAGPVRRTGVDYAEFPARYICLSSKPLEN